MKSRYMFFVFAAMLMALTVQVQGQWKHVELPPNFMSNPLKMIWMDTTRGLVFSDYLSNHGRCDYARTSNGGLTWEADSIVSPLIEFAVHTASFKEGRVGVVSFGPKNPLSYGNIDSIICHTPDAGRTWQCAPIQWPNESRMGPYYSSIQLLDTNTIVLVEIGGEETVSVSTDFGETWRVIAKDSPLNSADSLLYQGYGFSAISHHAYYLHSVIQADILSPDFCYGIRYSNDSGKTWSGLGSDAYNHYLNPRMSGVYREMHLLNDTSLFIRNDNDSAWVTLDARFHEQAEGWTPLVGAADALYDNGLLASLQWSDRSLIVEDRRIKPIPKKYTVDADSIKYLYSINRNKIYARRNSRLVVLDLATLATENPPAPQAHALAVYPNPVPLRDGEYLSIALPEANARYDLFVYDNLGRMVYTAEREEGHGASLHSLRIREVFAAQGPGMYYIRVQSSKGVFTGKVMVY